MSVYTITVTLTPQEDAALHARARQAGRAPEELLGLGARAQAAPGDGPAADDALVSEEALREEYHALVDRDMAGRLTPAQARRLRTVEEELDNRDEAGPGARWMEGRMAQTSDALDALLQAVQSLAARPQADGR